MRSHRSGLVGFVAVGLTSGPAGCVFPSDEPTGIELSWLFVEANGIDGEDIDADGEETERVRTCTGALIDTVGFHIVDNEDANRFGRFRWSCSEGFQTDSAFQTDSSGAFVELDAGGYTLTPSLQGDTTEDMPAVTVDVSSRGLTVERFTFLRTPISWTLELAGGTLCDEVRLDLQYTDPATTLAEFVTDTGDDEGDTQGSQNPDARTLTYRENLESDRGLPFGNAPTACGEDLDGRHVIAGVDRGDYTLVVTAGSQSCAIGVNLDDFGVVTTIDLANLPCGG